MGTWTFISEDESLVTLSVGQSFITGRLTWSRYGLDKGVPFEEDGDGFPPEYIRRHLIADDGEWEVIAEDSVNKTAVARVIRGFLELDMAAVGTLLKSLPGVIYRGTKVETNWLKMKLLESGVAVEVRRLR